MNAWLTKMLEAEEEKAERVRKFLLEQVEQGEDFVSAGLTGAEHAAYVEGLGTNS